MSGSMLGGSETMPPLSATDRSMMRMLLPLFSALRLSSRTASVSEPIRDPYVDGPRPTRDEQRVGSKRLRSYVRSVDAVAHDRCQDGARDASSKQVGDAGAPLDPAECLASWDR